MPETGSNFRSSVVGGFNRNDVIEYISKTHEAHSAEAERLKKELEAERTAKDTSITELRSAEAKLAENAEFLQLLEREIDEEKRSKDALQAELSELRDRAEEKERERGALLTERAELNAKLAAAAAKNDALGAVIAEQTGRINDYEQSKLRVADIELAAYERAKNIEETAGDKAVGIITEVLKYFKEAVAVYDDIHTGSLAKINSVVGQLKNVTGELEKLPGYLDDIARDLRLLNVEETPPVTGLEDEESGEDEGDACGVEKSDGDAGDGTDE